MKLWVYLHETVSLSSWICECLFMKLWVYLHEIVSVSSRNSECIFMKLWVYLHEIVTVSSWNCECITIHNLITSCAAIFQKSKSYLKIPGPRRLTWSNFHTEDPQSKVFFIKPHLTQYEYSDEATGLGEWRIKIRFLAGVSAAHSAPIRWMPKALSSKVKGPMFRTSGATPPVFHTLSCVRRESSIFTSTNTHQQVCIWSVLSVLFNDASNSQDCTAPVLRWMKEHGALVQWYWQGKTDVLGEEPAPLSYSFVF